MKKFYLLLQGAFYFFIFFPIKAKCQCALLDATYMAYESRCAATGSIKVNAFGGSGNYKYKTVGPVNTNFTSSDSITGLSAGVYTLVINDIVTNCTVSKTNIIVPGSYQDPRFTLTETDVSCDNASNGSITVNSYSYGRAPFTYSIVAPSAMGIGTNNSTGNFTGLAAGNYSIQMTDSCGGIQTRQITIVNYTWWIDSYSFIKTGCDEASGYIKVIDSKGNISTVSGIPGFTYGIVRAPGDTIWSSNPNFIFSLAGYSVFDVIAKDNCGIIKKANATLSLVPVVAATVTTYGYLCNFFSASLSTGPNFLNPGFCLFDNNNVQVSCNTTGIFTSLPYGSYCIKAHDECTDTTITRCFIVAAPPIAVSNNVLITNKTCTDFTATISGQVGLTNPQYCLYNVADNLISCNSSGIFTSLPYEPYCIVTTDGCRDTSIRRCFDVSPPTPVVPDVITPLYTTCTNFGIHVSGDSLTTPVFCLYDSSGSLITCNSTGVFDSIPLGHYCITVHDACYDTTITRCLSVLVPVINNDMVTVISDQRCSSFTVTVRSNNLSGQEFCLYTNSNMLVSCSMSGVFLNIPYGSYCIKVNAVCPDTLLVSCFSAYPALPSVAGLVDISGSTCNSFSAGITQQQNLTNPAYCIYDSLDVLISCNSSGQFDNLSYGRYCIKITDGCYDTTIIRCFTRSPVRISLNATAGKSCSYGYAQISLNMVGGIANLPVNIQIYAPDGSLFSDHYYYTNSPLIDSVPGVPAGQSYTIIATDNCGNRDSASTGSVSSYFTHSPAVIPKCPGATWINGSGNIVTTVLTNMGSLNVRIIKKNGVAYSPALVPNSVIAGVYTFLDLGPGTYIICATEVSCSKKLYDTVVISNYQYPNLDRSSAYQCDVNGFSVSAVASNGVGPFTYEIIGSQPTTPSIITAPQSSPVFTINNGSNYSLIRLRALDACGNATLGDASILPLSMNGTASTTGCISQPTTLSVDSLYNSTYEWYKKTEVSSTDSIFLGSGTSYFVPATSPSDTGIYVCYVKVNSGCINRSFTFHLGGECWIILPVMLSEFKGQTINEKNLLTWKTSIKENLRWFIIERKNRESKFSEIGKITPIGNEAAGYEYHFVDGSPGNGENLYRLKQEQRDHTFGYSNVIMLNSKKNSSFAVYPNPVATRFAIYFGTMNGHYYRISILNTMGQLIKEIPFTNGINSKLEIIRPSTMQKGIYILHIYDMDTKETFKEKLIFL